jgi:hypothetical protein
MGRNAWAAPSLSLAFATANSVKEAGDAQEEAISIDRRPMASP